MSETKTLDLGLVKLCEQREDLRARIKGLGKTAPVSTLPMKQLYDVEQKIAYRAAHLGLGYDQALALHEAHAAEKAREAKQAAKALAGGGAVEGRARFGHRPELALTVDEARYWLTDALSAREPEGERLGGGRAEALLELLAIVKREDLGAAIADRRALFDAQPPAVRFALGLPTRGDTSPPLQLLAMVSRAWAMARAYEAKLVGAAVGMDERAARIQRSAAALRAMFAALDGGMASQRGSFGTRNGVWTKGSPMRDGGMASQWGSFGTRNGVWTKGSPMRDIYDAGVDLLTTDGGLDREEAEGFVSEFYGDLDRMFHRLERQKAEFERLEENSRKPFRDAMHFFVLTLGQQFLPATGVEPAFDLKERADGQPPVFSAFLDAAARLCVDPEASLKKVLETRIDLATEEVVTRAIGRPPRYAPGHILGARVLKWLGDDELTDNTRAEGAPAPSRAERDDHKHLAGKTAAQLWLDSGLGEFPGSYAALGFSP